MAGKCGFERMSGFPIRNWVGLYVDRIDASSVGVTSCKCGEVASSFLRVSFEKSRLDVANNYFGTGGRGRFGGGPGHGGYCVCVPWYMEGILRGWELKDAGMRC